jgi:2-hydroxy-6-oxonona-2,4-dienedioate hydrolase
MKNASHARFRMGLRWFLGALLLAAAIAASTGGEAYASPQEKPDPKSEIGGLRSKYADVNGVRARYYELGRGETMVMIHGGFTAGSSTANVFSRNLPGLAKHFHVFVVDRLASGMSGNPTDDRNYSSQGDVDFIYNFIETLKLGKVHLVGHSAGGAIALYLSVQHPEIVKTLAVLADGPEDPPHGPTKLVNMLKKCPDQHQYAGLQCRVEQLAWLPTTFDEEYWKADEFMATQPKNREALAKVEAKSAERNADMTSMREKMLDRIKTEGMPQVPVLLVAGKNDVLDWAENDASAQLTNELALMDIIAAKSTKVQMFVFNNAGHFMYREHPEEFNAILTTWIDYWNSNPTEPPRGDFPK